MRYGLAPFLLFIGLTFAAQAQEPTGCDKFRWPLERERALLTSPQAVRLAAGAGLDSAPGQALILTLVPLPQAKLPLPPERSPKSPTSFAGAVRIGKVDSGSYLISLSADAWIDAVQDGHYLKSTAFSGALGCPGIRKSVKFDLLAAPLVIQLSGVEADTIALTLTPAK